MLPLRILTRQVDVKAVGVDRAAGPEVSRPRAADRSRGAAGPQGTAEENSAARQLKSEATVTVPPLNCVPRSTYSCP